MQSSWIHQRAQCFPQQQNISKAALLWLLRKAAPLLTLAKAKNQKSCIKWANLRQQLGGSFQSGCKDKAAFPNFDMPEVEPRFYQYFDNKLMQFPINAPM